MNGSRLREFREQRFMSQKELATKTGLTIATVSRLEGGKHRPHFATVRRLAEALGVRPQTLMDGGGRR